MFLFFFSYFVHYRYDTSVLWVHIQLFYVYNPIDLINIGLNCSLWRGSFMFFDFFGGNKLCRWFVIFTTGKSIYALIVYMYATHNVYNIQMFSILSISTLHNINDPFHMLGSRESLLLIEELFAFHLIAMEKHKHTLTHSSTHAKPLISGNICPSIDFLKNENRLGSCLLKHFK